MKTAFSSFIYSRRGIYGILHILILLMSLFLVISISIDTFHNIPFLNQGSYLKIQFWICMFFLFDFLLEFFLSKEKRKILHQPFYFPFPLSYVGKCQKCNCVCTCTKDKTRKCLSAFKNLPCKIPFTQQVPCFRTFLFSVRFNIHTHWKHFYYAYSFYCYLHLNFSVYFLKSVNLTVQHLYYCL